jgi:small subunit ribosomal protein S1
MDISQEEKAKAAAKGKSHESDKRSQPTAEKKSSLQPIRDPRKLTFEDEGERTEFLQAMSQELEVKRTHRGEMIQGTIVSFGADYAFVDIGGKSEGVISIEEIKAEDGSLPSVGSAVEACILSTGADGLVLSKKLAKGIRSKEFLGEAARNKIPVEGRVSGRNKGGYEVEVAGVRAFCPVSQIDLRFTEDLDVHLGKRYMFVITKFDDDDRRPDLVLSRRVLLEAEQESKARELRKSLKVGDVMPGTVRNIRDFGAFVDLGGLDGLLPVSEMSYSRVQNPKDILQEGEEIHVEIIAIEQGGERITLSLKRLEQDPWADVVSAFPPGSRLTGRVVRLAPFGAFVELSPGVEGLIHISQFNTPERINHPQAVVAEGQEVLVEVLEVSPEKRRIGLMRVPGEGEFGAIPVAGAILEGKIDKVEAFGVFVTLGPGRKGLIPNSEMGTAKGTDHRKQFAPGTAIKVQVLEVTEGGKRIRLSRKAALDAEERADFEGYVDKSAEGSSKNFGTFGDLLKKKMSQ